MFISKEYISIGMRHFRAIKSKAIRAYAGQYHTIVESPWFLTLFLKDLFIVLLDIHKGSSSGFYENYVQELLDLKQKEQSRTQLVEEIRKQANEVQ